jgi:hypothetical protein
MELEEVVRTLEKAWGVKIFPMPQHAVVNYMAVKNGTPCAMLDVKCIKRRLAKNPLDYLPKAKSDAGRILEKILGLPFFSVISTDEEILWVHITNEKPPTMLRGCIDREDDKQLDSISNALPIKRLI